MKQYILYRILYVIPILFVISIITFSLMHLTPGDPALVILGPTASEADIKSLQEALGLNEPFYIQYFNWIGGVIQGDLGQSIFLETSVMSALLAHLGPTISLTVLSFIFAIIISIPLGIQAAKLNGYLGDQMLMGVALLGISLPSFLVGLLLIMFFSVNLNLLPSGGYVPISSGLWNHLKHLILPAFSLGFFYAGLIARMTRSSMLEVFSENYIKTARSKGLNEKVVIYKHALKNAFIPILTVIGQVFALLIGGSVLIENVFNIPGIGQLVVNSVARRDYSVIQGALLLIAANYVFINLIIDLLYGWLDPRVRINSKD